MNFGGESMPTMIAVGAVVVLVLIVIARTAIVVPQQSAFVVEYLGKYRKTIQAGFHILVPFVEKVAYRHSLKEIATDIAEQVCITRDNVQVGVDGVLYLKVLDPQRASYGIADFHFAIAQLAQTTLRSEIGKIDLDRTFEERAAINQQVVQELDKASEPWGVKVLRYEIKNINPPRDILGAMEKQMRAEREKRATILASEGERDAQINRAEGEKQRVIKESEATRQRQINEAQGEAEAILAVATATAEGLRQVAIAIHGPGGNEGHAAADGRAVRDRVRQAGQGGQHAGAAGQPVGYREHDCAGDECHQAGAGGCLRAVVCKATADNDAGGLSSGLSWPCGLPAGVFVRRRSARCRRGDPKVAGAGLGVSACACTRAP
jgi:regulator of protease activity HflC (stomatin/prohibitin superfamily)